MIALARSGAERRGGAGADEVAQCLLLPAPLTFTVLLKRSAPVPRSLRLRELCVARVVVHGHRPPRVYGCPARRVKVAEAHDQAQ